MTKIPHLKYFEVGEIYKVRAQVEQEFRNNKNDLGWADFRLTKYADIQKWWELVMCAYLMVCLHNVSFNPAVAPVPDPYQQHSLWDSGEGWKSAPPALRSPQRKDGASNALNNIQLILQPFISFNLILRWLKVFPVPQLSLGFPRLITKINGFDYLKYLVYCWDEFYCSFA